MPVRLTVQHIAAGVVLELMVWVAVSFALFALLLLLTVALVVIYASRSRAVGLPPEALRANNRRMAAYMIVTLVVTAAAIVAANNWIVGSTDRITHYYLVEVDTDLPGEWVVMCPVPCDREGNLYQGFMEELEIDGAGADLQLLETATGPALRVEASGPLEILWQASWGGDGDRFENLTMTDVYDDSVFMDEFGHYVQATSWVYSAQEGCSLNLEFTSKHTYITRGWTSGGAEFYGIMEDLSGVGWELVEVDYGGMIIN